MIKQLPVFSYLAKSADLTLLQDFNPFSFTWEASSWLELPGVKTQLIAVFSCCTMWSRKIWLSKSMRHAIFFWYKVQQRQAPNKPRKKSDLSFTTEDRLACKLTASLVEFQVLQHSSPDQSSLYEFYQTDRGRIKEYPIKQRHLHSLTY